MLKGEPGRMGEGPGHPGAAGFCTVGALVISRLREFPVCLFAL